MTASRRPRHPHSRWAVTALRRAVRAVRYVHEELIRASEAIVRSARVPQPRPPAGGVAGTRARAASATERDLAA
jgi:hypothetical protein